MSMPTAVWSVTELAVFPQYGNRSNVVRRVFWRCRAEGPSTSGLTLAAERTGAVDVPFDGNAPFVEYPDITEDLALAWVWPHVNVTEIDNAVRRDWSVLDTPPLVTPPLPWSG